MEIFGLFWMTGVTLFISTVLAALAWFFRRSRPASLSLWITPPIAIATLILSRWIVLDLSPSADQIPNGIAALLHLPIPQAGQSGY
jgi:hypothetical protein